MKGNMMLRHTTILLFALCVPCSAQNWITVGEPGNPPLQTGPLAGRGTVDYSYQVADRPVNNREFVDFLNATQIPFVMPDYSLSFGRGEEAYYTLEGTEDLPATGMDWLSAARYVNWLHSDGTTTEDGAYTLVGEPVNTFFEYFGWFMILNQETLTRNEGSRYWLPTWDEFVKATPLVENRIPGGSGGGEHGAMLVITEDCPHNKYECYPTVGIGSFFQPDGNRSASHRMIDAGNLGLRLHAPAEGVTLLGDADLDGDLDSADLLAFLGEWTGQQKPVLVQLWEGKVPLWSSRSDIDRDGDVDSNDLLGVLGNWTGASAQVPEPSGLVLGLLAMLYGLRASKPSRAFRYRQPHGCPAAVGTALRKMVLAL